MKDAWRLIAGHGQRSGQRFLQALHALHGELLRTGQVIPVTRFTVKSVKRMKDAWELIAGSDRAKDSFRPFMPFTVSYSAPGR